MAIYKDVEFEQFIKTIEDGAISHWQEIAEALDVDPDTITKWKKTDRAIEARQKGIAHALQQMEFAGKKDWRMWQEKLKMLGINPPNKVQGDIKLDDRREILARYGLGEPNDAREAKETKD